MNQTIVLKFLYFCVFILVYLAVTTSVVAIVHECMPSISVPSYFN